MLVSLEDSSTPEPTSNVDQVYLNDLLREQLPYLENHLKAALLSLSSFQVPPSPRLSDKSLKSLLLSSIDAPPVEEDHTTWDTPSADTTLRHLPLTLHASPHTLLRQLPSFSALSLTSLNLAYSTLHPDLERLVTVLPSTLRELGLAGVRVGGTKSLNVEGWRRALGMLARKLIVLRVSYYWEDCADRYRCWICRIPLSSRLCRSWRPCWIRRLLDSRHYDC